MMVSGFSQVHVPEALSDFFCMSTQGIDLALKNYFLIFFTHMYLKGNCRMALNGKPQSGVRN
jgi:hypothetical protein